MDKETRKLKSVDVLLAEYNELRAEIRDSLNAAETNFRILIATLTGIFGFAFSGEIRIIYLVPTVLFLYAMIQQIKVATHNLLGSYLVLIERKMKKVLGDKYIMFNWEGGEIRDEVVRLFGPVHSGLLVLYILFSILFWTISYLAYIEWPPSIYIHIAEFALFLGYYLYSTRVLRPGNREKWLAKQE